MLPVNAPKKKILFCRFQLQVVKYAAENGNGAAERKFGVSEKLVVDWRKLSVLLILPIHPPRYVLYAIV